MKQMITYVHIPKRKEKKYHFFSHHEIANKTNI